jgi:hypothetical protein
MPVAQVGLNIGSELELTTSFGRRCVDARRGQTQQMVVALARIDDMNCPIAEFKPLLYKREQNVVFFLVAIEEGADMSRPIKLRSGKPDFWRSVLQ